MRRINFGTEIKQSLYAICDCALWHSSRVNASKMYDFRKPITTNSLKSYPTFPIVPLRKPKHNSLLDGSLTTCRVLFVTNELHTKLYETKRIFKRQRVTVSFDYGTEVWRHFLYRSVVWRSSFSVVVCIQVALPSTIFITSAHHVIQVNKETSFRSNNTIQHSEVA